MCFSEHGKAVKSFTLPDAVTVWNIHSVSVSDSSGVCVPAAASITVKKSIFLNLNLPPYAVRGEHRIAILLC